jgi:hypothetical protein
VGMTRSQSSRGKSTASKPEVAILLAAEAMKKRHLRWQSA